MQFLRASRRVKVDLDGRLVLDGVALSPLRKLVCLLLWSKAKPPSSELTRFIKFLPPNKNIYRTMDPSVAGGVTRHRVEATLSRRQRPSSFVKPIKKSGKLLRSDQREMLRLL